MLDSSSFVYIDTCMFRLVVKSTLQYTSVGFVPRSRPVCVSVMYELRIR